MRYDRRKAANPAGRIGNRDRCAVIGAICAGAMAALPVQAAGYPDKPIRLIVQYGVGGSTDVIARVTAQRLSEAIGQQVIVDNRPGANGIIATELVAKAAPDGYTLLFNTNADAVNVSLYKKLPYDLERDFAPVTFVGATPHLVVVHPSVPVKTAQELIGLAKQKPGQLNFASVGTGSTPHLAGELFQSMASIKIVHVLYKVSAQSISDLVGGQIQLMFLGAVSGSPFVQSGKLRLLAVTSARRLPAFAETPTVAEAAGLAGYEAATWFGLLAPAATPVDMVEKLNRDAIAVLNNAETKSRFSTLGAYSVGNSPKEFAEFQKSEIRKWAKVLRDAGVNPE